MIVIAFAPAARATTLDAELRAPERLLQIACPASDSILLSKSPFFTVCYQTHWRIPRWVAYFLTPADLEGDTPRSDDFREDKAIQNVALRSTLADYRGSGYARGHMAPAKAFNRSPIAMSTTFLLSNMAPQTGSLNSGKWRSLETGVRKVVAANRGVWIVTGNLFVKESRRGNVRHFTPDDPDRHRRSNKRYWIGHGRVAVPSHSFKAILVARENGTLVGYGFIMPNQRHRLPLTVAGYQVAIDTIEQLAGIDVFSALDDELERRLESDVPAWPPKKELSR